MTNKEIVEKAKRGRTLARRRLRDPRVRRVLGFLVAKKLLVAPGIIPRPRVKLTRDEVLYVARYVEPRVEDVLAEAMACYPESFHS